MQKRWMSNEGSALPIVLTIMVIVVIFSVTALTIGSASMKQAENQELRVQAYYMARSGAHAVASLILNKAETLSETDMNTFVSNLNGKTSEPFNLDGTGEIRVTVTKPSEDLLVVSSTALLETMKQTVSVDILVEKSATKLILTKAAYSSGEIKINNGNVYGDIFASEKVTFTGGKVHGEVYVSDGISVVPNGSNTGYYNGSPKPQPVTPTFSTVSFPDPPTKPVISTHVSSLTVDTSGEIRNDIYFTNGIFVNNGKLTIYKSSDREIYANRFTVGGSGVVNDDGGNGALLLYIENDFSVTANNNITFTIGDSDTNIVMKKLNLGGNIIVKRPAGKKGKLNLYISEEFNFNYGQIKFEGEEDETQAINLYYEGTKTLTLASNAAIPGLLYVKQADLKLSGGSRTSGCIISGGKNITITGGANIISDMIYAPDASVTISAGGNVTGCIISDSLTMDGGAVLTFKPLDTGFEEWTGGTPGKISYNLGKWH